MHARCFDLPCISLLSNSTHLSNHSSLSTSCSTLETHWVCFVLPGYAWVESHLLELSETAPSLLCQLLCQKDSRALPWPMMGICLTWSCSGHVHVVTAVVSLHMQALPQASKCYLTTDVHPVSSLVCEHVCERLSWWLIHEGGLSLMSKAPFPVQVVLGHIKTLAKKSWNEPESETTTVPA